MLLRSKSTLLLACLLALLAVGAASPEFIRGRVVAITDGDTLRVLLQPSQQVIVRLLEIDAPEDGQPWSARSKQALSALVFGQDVELRTSGKDQYGRLLARIYVSGTDVNAEMVRQGHAWAYREYLTDKSLLAIEETARSAKRGLWNLPASETVPPWTWRRGVRLPYSTGSVPSPAPGGSQPFCGAKRYCREMTSCDEARYYLNVCRVRTLDGDNDGVPCENLCRR